MKSSRLLFALVLAAALLRVLGLRGELWLDEIHSLNLALSLSAPAQVFSLYADNNHPLNTLWLHLVGPTAPAALYRLLALLMAVGTLLLLAFTPQLERIERVFALLFFGFSYLLILYGSEARGYSGAVFCTVAGVLLWRRELGQKPMGMGGPAPLLWWSLVALGCAFHASFLLSLAALGCYSLYQLRQQTLWPRWALMQLPALTIGWIYYSLFVARLNPATGPLGSHLEVLLEYSSLLWGGPQLSYCHPQWGALALLGAPLLLSLLTIEIRCCWREKDPAALLYLAALLTPLIVLLTEPRLLFPRYFLVNAAIIYLALAALGRRAWKLGGPWRRLTVLLCGAFIAANGLYLADFQRYGRGTYSAALQAISARSSGAQLLGSDHDYRNRTVLKYFQGQNAAFKRLQLLPATSTALPHWYLLHSLDSCPPLSTAPPDCSLVDIFRHTALSGWSWYLYDCRVRESDAPDL